MQREKINLPIASGESAAAAGGEEDRVGPDKISLRQASNVNVVTRSNHGLKYAPISSLPGSGWQSSWRATRKWQMTIIAALTVENPREGAGMVQLAVCIDKHAKCLLKGDTSE